MSKGAAAIRKCLCHSPQTHQLCVQSRLVDCSELPSVLRMSQKQHRQEDKGRTSTKRGVRREAKRAASERERRVCVVNSRGMRGTAAHKRKAAEAREGGAPHTGSSKQRCFPPAHAPQQLDGGGHCAHCHLSPLSRSCVPGPPDCTAGCACVDGALALVSCGKGLQPPMLSRALDGQPMHSTLRQFEEWHHIVYAVDCW
ncbi:hypothetical protein GQ54DRAFT_182004 [Martensiomyces pterosporus]|nr:hypothetical protein GQ54DRAFT_182004 [Martensiomyces pterosporus]